MMLYDYENIWENIVYIQAREGSGRNNKQKHRYKKWRKILKFPSLAECEHFDAEEGSPLKDYNHVVNKQPIGSKLFHQFCSSSPNTAYHHLVAFINEARSYELELEENRERAAVFIIQKYLGGVPSQN